MERKGFPINPLQKQLQALFDRGQWADRRHLFTFAQMVSALIQSGSSNLTDWLAYVSASRAQYAASKLRRFMRWLTNWAVKPLDLYAPVIREALSQWGQHRLYLLLDTSVLWDEFCLIRVSVLYRGRAVPLVWNVLEQASASVKFEEYAKLLRRVPPLLPAGAEVVLMGDRGFADLHLMALCRTLGWHWRLRIKANFLVRPPRGPSFRVDELSLKPGQAMFLQNVHLGVENFGPVNLALARPSSGEDNWYVATDEPADMRTFEEYSGRFDIEENFLDDKSNGFQVESSKLRNAKSLTRLFLVLAAATLYLTSQGTEVVRQNKRRYVDPHWYRGQSYLRIGWEWVKMALQHGLELLRDVRLFGGPDPDPSMASKRLYEQRLAQQISILDFECISLK